MKKIRVLHVVSNMNCGGAETMIMNIFRNIDCDKFQFDFLCLSPIAGEYEEEILKRGGKIQKVNSSRNIMKIYKILKEGQYDAIHIHVMFYSWILLFLSYLANIKVRITHSHSASDLKPNTNLRKIYIKISRILINVFTTNKISCGEKAGHYLFGKNNKFIILNNGIDLEKYSNVTEKEILELKRSLNIEKDSMIIGHVGGFRVEKNQKYFIDLAKVMKNNKEKFKIILVGNGYTFKDIEEEIQKQNLEEYFILPGKRDDVNIFMNLFDVFMMPSLYEGFPLVVVEALAANNICFLSDKISKETDLMENRVYFFDIEMDKKIIIDKMKKAIKDKKNINTIIKLNELGFSSKSMTNKICNIYESRI